MKMLFTTSRFFEWVTPRKWIGILLAPGIIMLLVVIAGSVKIITGEAVIVILSAATIFTCTYFTRYFLNPIDWRSEENKDEAKSFLAKTHYRLFENTESVTPGEHTEFLFESAVDRFTQFKKFFSRFWLSLALMYMVTMLSPLYAGTSILGVITKILEFTFNNVSVYYILKCFITFYPFKVYDLDGLYEDKSRVRVKKEQLEYKKQVIVNYSRFFLFMLSACYSLMIIISVLVRHDKALLNATTNAFYTLGGLINGIIFAMFIGRLVSKFIGLPSKVIGLLFLYPAIQPLFVAFNEKQTLLYILIYVSFLCKLFFFLSIQYVCKTGRLLRYYYSFFELDTRVGFIYGNQFEIIILKNHHHDKYYFEIRNENKQVFIAETLYKNRMACIDAINDIRWQLQHNALRTSQMEKFGTHWAEISGGGFLLFYSIEFKREEELAMLLDDLKQKGPYCKVSFG